MAGKNRTEALVIPETPADGPAPAGIHEASALAHRSRRRIAAVLAEHPEGLTVARLAQEVGLHHNAVREHLRVLAAAGVVSSARDKPSGRGRPTERYLLEGDLAPRVAAHEELVRLLVGLLDRAGIGAETARRFGRERGGELARAAGREGIVRSLAGLGFAPHETTSAADALRGELAVRLEHCPFREAVLARGGERICALHHGLLEGMADRAGPGAEVTEFVPKDPRWAGCTARVRGLEPAGGEREDTA